MCLIQLTKGILHINFDLTISLIQNSLDRNAIINVWKDVWGFYGVSDDPES